METDESMSMTPGLQAAWLPSCQRCYHDDDDAAAASTAEPRLPGGSQVHRGVRDPHRAGWGPESWDDQHGGSGSSRPWPQECSVDGSGSLERPLSLVSSPALPHHGGVHPP